jgi:hypothetical protein
MDMDGRLIFKTDLQGAGWGVLTGLIWLRIGTGDWLLSTH